MQALGRAQINLETDDIRVVAIDTALYTYSAAHDFLDDVAAGARVGTPVALAGKAVLSDGIFDADDPVFTAITGPTVEALWIYIHNASEAAARLLLWIDTATNLPFTPNGGNVTVQWPSTGDRIGKY
jgi:hypothetical protein